MPEGQDLDPESMGKYGVKDSVPKDFTENQCLPLNMFKRKGRRVLCDTFLIVTNIRL
jgi:hypothetical protein